MLKSVSGYLQILAGEMSKGPDKEEYHIAGIKVFFSAPNPKKPSSNTLTIKKEVSDEANFQWIAYQVLFTYKPKDSKDASYYIYSIDLEPAGTEKPPSKVFESDSNWSGKNKENPSREILPGEIKLALPKILKGPDLFPPEVGKTIEYINVGKDDKGHSYSLQEFKKNFDNDFYIVINPKSSQLKNPFGKLIGKNYPKEQP